MLRLGIAAQHPDVFVSAVLIGRADAPVGATRQACGLYVDRFLAGICLGHVDNNQSLAVDTLDGDFRTQWMIERAGALRREIFLGLVGIGHAFWPVLGIAFFVDPPLHAQEQPSPSQSRLIGKGNDRIHQRFADLTGALGFNAR